jgi:hypothetical protein
MSHTIAFFIEHNSLIVKRISKFLIGEWVKAKNPRTPFNMNLKDAKQFVALFITGEYAPEEYAAFLQWLKGATIDELNAIASEHEALHECWCLPFAVPSPEWIAKLEEKLDKAGEPGPC